MLVRVLTALKHLTGRGRSFLAAGILIAVAALVFHDLDLARIAVLLLALPAASAIAVRQVRFHLSCTHTLEPGRVAAGGEATVVISVRNLSRVPTGLMLVEDTVPYTLGGRPRFRVNHASPGALHAVRYPVHADARGRYGIGPLAIRIRDPFGLVELTRTFTGVDTLTVTPAVSVLSAGPAGIDRASGDGMRGGSLAQYSADDAGIREYRRGDDLRRVHWRTTARTGQLMVRREERPLQKRATVLLDNRAGAHAGEDAESSFEWAVTAAASIAVYLENAGYTTRLASSDQVTRGPSPRLGVDAILDLLADIDLDSSDRIGLASALPAHASADDLDSVVVMVTGTLHLDDAERLAAGRSQMTVGVAILLDVESWVPRSAGRRGAGTDPFEIQAAERILHAAGWAVVRARSGDTVAGIWRRFGAAAPTGGGSTFGGRTAAAPHTASNDRPVTVR